MFLTASQQMADQQFSDATQTLGEINSVLDAIEHDTSDPFSASQMAAEYLSIASDFQKQGYEVQSIEIDGDSTLVSVTNSSGPDLIELRLTRTAGEWLLSPERIKKAHRMVPAG
jgi:hypothetical protein